MGQLSQSTKNNSTVKVDLLAKFASILRQQKSTNNDIKLALGENFPSSIQLST